MSRSNIINLSIKADQVWNEDGLIFKGDKIW